MVVGIQFVSLGLISELVTSQHEERIGERERTERMVEERSASRRARPLLRDVRAGLPANLK